MKHRFRILSINISEKKGIPKKPISSVFLKKDHGILGDAHAGDWERQVSLLASEDIDTMKKSGLDIGFGDFAENITTEGVELSSLPLGSILYIGDAILEVSQIGKECHKGCAIKKAVGDCVMPRKGIFAKVLKGGKISCESSCYYDL